MTTNFILWINKKKNQLFKIHSIFNFKPLNGLEFESVAHGQIFFEKMFLT